MTVKLLGPAPSGSTDAATKGYVDTSTTPGNSGLTGGAGSNLSAAAGTGISISSGIALTVPVAVANGGTGSTSQNFVDLTTNQSIAGIKTFSREVVVPAPS